MTTKKQEKMIAEMFRMILHLEVEIVDTNPTYYNGNRWSNDVANIFYQCEKGGKTIENMEKVILLAHGWMEENGNCYIDDSDGNEDNWKKFWKLEEDVWEIWRLQRDGLYSEEEEAEEAEEAEDTSKVSITIPCKRCNGAGGFKQFAHVYGGVCFRCDGLGVELQKTA